MLVKPVLIAASALFTRLKQGVNEKGVERRRRRSEISGARFADTVVRAAFVGASPHCRLATGNVAIANRRYD